MNLKVSPNGNILVQYHNQTIEIDQSTDIIWIFPVLPGGGGGRAGCVCIALYNFITCINSCIQHYSQDTE